MASQSGPPASAAAQYPEPLIVPPLQAHTQTFIILHGRGSNAHDFGPELLKHPVPDFGSLRQAFPNAKFVFPTASKRRAALFNRTPINQWFDNWVVEMPMKREELQIQGLRETSAYIHALMEDAVKEVGADNLIVGGLSQGSAAALISVLTWDGEPIRAAFGLCGWLSFARGMEEVINGKEDLDCDKDDPFVRSVEHEGRASLSSTVEAVSCLREDLGYCCISNDPPASQVPVFIGHGDLDEKVTVGLGRQEARCLAALGMEVEYKEYGNLGHWYSSDMLADLITFIQSRGGMASCGSDLSTIA